MVNFSPVKQVTIKDRWYNSVGQRDRPGYTAPGYRQRVDPMPIIYVARSKSLSDWGASVGISKSLFKIGVTDGTGKAAVTALNDEECAGLDDWRLVGSEEAAELDEDAALERLAMTDMVVEPTYYPRIRGEPGILRVKPEKVENSLLVAKALSGEASLDFKVKPTDFATYLIKIARG